MTPRLAIIQLDTGESMPPDSRDTARPLIFDDVVVRVRSDFAAAMHIDTDESNAACAFGEVYGEIRKK